MHVAYLSLQDVVRDAEETLEGSYSAVTASRIQLQHTGLSETSEGDSCPICLGEVSDAACVALCFHHFCFGCIWWWPALKALCPLCRQPFNHFN